MVRRAVLCVNLVESSLPCTVLGWPEDHTWVLPRIWRLEVGDRGVGKVGFP